MSLLHQRVNEYLALRRAMGFKLREHGLLLPRFADFVEQSGAATVSVDLMLDWATQPTGVDPFRWRSRLSVVRGFARYLRVFDSATQVPPPRLLAYLHNQWKGLVRFCDDGRYGIDTNPVENAIRPFAVGRRNWLFADTVAGAHASARLYSLIECAKANGLEPYAYLRQVFTELPKAQSLADIEALLPTRLDPAALARDSLQDWFPAARQ